MSFRIVGLEADDFAPYFFMSDAELRRSGARMVVADAHPGFPCRVSLDDARRGERVLLINFTSHDVANPYRTAHAIYIREGVSRPEPWIDRLPPVFAGRTMSLRGFDDEGMIVRALLAWPGEVEAGIAALFAEPRVACVHAHNAAYGCFAARIEREGDGL
ncbi:DUF1203 domain-containing protein [Novosphingobium clariflavum]|uniref:DUF1203 domain-containing protein n=1 Tax=Novosphingobium clariflavum TaxID=2029884 RepID=A0ABV6S9U1_9SPHN|nr:DUF1203 domain-containing protein [Novosphingobium clariflavum]